MAEEWVGRTHTEKGRVWTMGREGPVMSRYSSYMYHYDLKNWNISKANFIFDNLIGQTYIDIGRFNEIDK